ncbi:hypothetical protein [Xanthomonas maliensis]|uniref:hypothetical protein n=1 Tax=Xanthomonas maliensis TaxID=1321368 RepID=UPI0003B62E2B|nr:hypothetical protein [Xanthomonas maliensis]
MKDLSQRRCACWRSTYPLTLLNGRVGGDPNPTDALLAGQLSIASVLAISLINPIFEEVFVCGYVYGAGAAAMAGRSQ